MIIVTKEEGRGGKKSGLKCKIKQYIEKLTPYLFHVFSNVSTDKLLRADENKPVFLKGLVVYHQTPTMSIN